MSFLDRIQDAHKDLWEWSKRTPLRRFLTLVASPLWSLAIAAEVFVFTCLCIASAVVLAVASLLWNGSLWLLSWIRFGNVYVWAHLWILTMFDKDHLKEIKKKTKEARSALGRNGPTVF